MNLSAATNRGVRPAKQLVAFRGSPQVASQADFEAIAADGTRRMAKLWSVTQH